MTSASAPAGTSVPAPAGTSVPAPGPGVSDVPGRVAFAERALTSLARAAAAEQLGVGSRRVRVGLSDRAGDLVLDVVGPVAAGTDLVSRMTDTAPAICRRVTELTGRRVAACDIELVGIVRTTD